MPPNSTLRTVLQLFAPLYRSKPSLKVLACLRLTRTGGVTTIQGTDLDRTLVWAEPAELPPLNTIAGIMEKNRRKKLQDLDVLLPFKTLQSLTAKADPRASWQLEFPATSDSPATFTTTTTAGGSLTITAFDADPKDYPPLPPCTIKVDPEDPERERLLASHSTTVPDLRTSLQRVLAAVSSDETRYVLNGVLLEGATGNLVATDGRRLHISSPCSKLPAPSSDLPHLEAIIPHDTAKLLLSLVPAGDTVTFHKHGDSTLRLTTSLFTLYSRVIEGSFPNYKQVIPSPNDFKQHLTLDPATARAMQTTLSLAARHETAKADIESVTLPDFTTKWRLILRGENDTTIADQPINDVDATTYEIKAAQVRNRLMETRDTQMRFAPSFLQDALAAAAQSEAPITCHIINDISPLTLEAPRFTAVLMPMRRNA